MALDLPPPELLLREQAITGTDHLKLSVALMEHWGIPIEYAHPFGRYEDVAALASVAQPGTPLIVQRALLAHCAWVLSRVLATEGSDAALDSPACAATLQWLQLDREALQQHLQEIESVWRVWLALIARQG
jgi:hypothetical protein